MAQVNIGDAFKAARSVSRTVSNLAGAVNNLSDPSKLVSSIRSLNLPIGGELSKLGSMASAVFGGDAASKDWRVRLSVPSDFLNSPILSPLRLTENSLIFPYTPAIALSGSANYDSQAITHQNYQFIHYQSSKAEQIQITAPFNVEDSDQAFYWLAAVHFLRSVTKMFTGNDPNSGNPPPIVKLNGYGDYVFKNIPVVVQGFSVDLPQDVDYISTGMSVAAATPAESGMMGTVASVSGGVTKLAGLAGAMGANRAAKTLSKIGTIGGAVAGIGKLLNPTSGSATAGSSWVPVKSTLTVTLQPIYSRQSMKEFSLTKFVNGEYVNRGYL